MINLFNKIFSKKNPSVAKDIIKKYNVKYRCLIFNTPIDICIHNSYYRNYISDNQISVIPKMVFNMMKKKYEKPTNEEGFCEISEIEFTFNGENKEIYTRYYS